MKLINLKVALTIRYNGEGILKFKNALEMSRRKRKIKLIYFKRISNDIII